jgi:very-short-patch-repair endonuclease
MKELDKEMYYGATSETIGKAKALRKNMTKAEELLWERLNKKQILGLRFRRQHPINIFIADFYCHAARIVVELDGEIHEIPENKEYDIAREEELKKFGIEVIRFKNYEVLNNIDFVISSIEHFVSVKVPLGGFRGKIDRKPNSPWGI